MATRRASRIGQAILETVSTAVLFELRDPRIKNVTVLRVEVAPDLRSAKVFVSVMGDEAMKKLCLHGLESSRGYLQKRIGDRLQIRYTPLLNFELDNAATANVMETQRILAELELERKGESETEVVADVLPPAES
jgi:ribosome-binding factor A